MKSNNKSPQQDIEFYRLDFPIDEFVYKKATRLFFMAVFIMFVVASHLVQAQIKYKSNVQTVSGTRIVGQILRITKDSLYLVVDNRKQLVVAGSEIKALRIKKKGAAGRGLIIGAATGIIIGGVIGYASYTPPDCSSGWCWDFGPEYDAYGGALLGFVAGSLLGSAIGGSGKEFKIEQGKGILEEAMIYVTTSSLKDKTHIEN